MLGVLGDFRTDFKLILDSSNGWSAPTFFGMGGSGSKKTENVVADSVDFSTNLSKDFAVLRLHGGTIALMAGVAATGILIYLAYKVFFCGKGPRWGRREGLPRGRSV